MASPQLWRIELLLETNDQEVVNRFVDDVTRLACSDTDADHECDPPWCVITSPVSGRAERKTVRELLNR